MTDERFKATLRQACRRALRDPANPPPKVGKSAAAPDGEGPYENLNEFDAIMHDFSEMACCDDSRPIYQRLTAFRCKLAAIPPQPVSGDAFERIADAISDALDAGASFQAISDHVENCLYEEHNANPEDDQ